ncbi:hypothetical protein [Deinococcus sp. Leaf326]|uniref:hypothetical protein n=1 Tax=Deinococcus sp. Leaf326 TaxID=1736338 RepID=UPI0009E77BD4|nr:hypothetical protein [Deinococcus sp. Leaf326]
MNRSRTVRFSGAAAAPAFLTLALLSGAAGAQNLGAYGALAQSLDAAAQSSGQNAVATLNALDRAGAALDRLVPTLNNPTVVTGLRDTLDAARAAQARTPAELQAQLLLARGLMRRSLYDQTVTVLAVSPANAADRLRVLAREFGLDAAGTQALQTDARAGQVSRVAWRLQREGAARLSSALGSVTPTRSAASYLALARATSWFTVVQDAGRAAQPPLETAQFNTALTQLTSGDLNALGTSLAGLRRSAASLRGALVSPPSATGAPAGQTPAAQTPTEQTPAGQAAAPSATGTPAAQTPTAQTPVTGTPAATAGSGGLATAYAGLGRALTAAGHGDPEAARAALADVGPALAGAPAALRGAPGFDSYLGDVQTIGSRAGLRPDDVQALIAGLGALERRADGQGTSLLDRWSLGTSQWLGGAVRALLGLLLALACAAPLYLLQLAFGGRNPYWRAISAALALLLLPTFLDGVFGFLGWLGDLTGLGLLRGASNLTLSQAPYGLGLHGLLVALALGLATYGFRGLCVQFGLLGGGRTKVQTPVAAPTSLDWDEEV